MDPYVESRAERTTAAILRYCGEDRGKVAELLDAAIALKQENQRKLVPLLEDKANRALIEVYSTEERIYSEVERRLLKHIAEDM